jgi:hypothetical protein
LTYLYWLQFAVSMYAIAKWRKHYLDGVELREMLKERDELLDFAVGRSYERGWNDRTAFTRGVYAHVQPAARRPN